MNIIKKNNTFVSLNSFSTKEYIYLLNYTNELITKYNDNLLDPILMNFSILVIKAENTLLSNYLLNQCLNLKKLCLNLNILTEDQLFISVINSDLSIIIGSKDYMLYDNFIQLNSEVFSTIFTLGYILEQLCSKQFHSENDEKQIKEEEKLIQLVDKNIFLTLIKNIFEKKDYLGFLKNKEIDTLDIAIKTVPHKEIFFIILGIIIMMIRKNYN